MTTASNVNTMPAAMDTAGANSGLGRFIPPTNYEFQDLKAVALPRYVEWQTMSNRSKTSAGGFDRRRTKTGHKGSPLSIDERVWAMSSSTAISRCRSMIDLSTSATCDTRPASLGFLFRSPTKGCSAFVRLFEGAVARVSHPARGGPASGASGEDPRRADHSLWKTHSSNLPTDRENLHPRHRQPDSDRRAHEERNHVQRGRIGEARRV
jgi:hypothetical protein